MSDENVEQVEDSKEEPSEAVEETEEQKQPETAEEQPEGTAEAEEGEENPFLIRTKIDGEEREFDLNDPEIRQQVQEHISKGFDYTKKLQKVAEWEKTNDGFLKLGQTVANDPTFLKVSLAQQMGLDPSLVFSNPSQPPEWLKTENPEQYADALAVYKQSIMAKQVIDNGATQYAQTMAQTNNQMLFDKSRMKYDLEPGEFAEFTNYVNNKIQPNQSGMYDESDMEAAYWAVLGKKRSGRDRLQTSETIRKTIQQGVTEASPTKAIPQKRERLTKQQKEEREFLDYVREHAP